MAWEDILSPRQLYGTGAPPATSAPPGLASSAGASVDDTPPPWSPDNALFWLFVIAGVTVGLIGLNANLRVGPFRAGASAGKD